MRKKGWLLLAACGLLAMAARADSDVEAIVWLQRMAGAAQKLNYTGTFTYQSGGNVETSRITHVVDASGEHEKLELLDGSPREIIRNNDEVRCFLPEDKMVIVEKRGTNRTFPALLPSSVKTLGEHYVLRRGGAERVAGFVARQIVLEPRDKLRYGHVLWADIDSGLLLRARMINENNEVIEQIAFTQLEIGGAVGPDALKPKFSAQSAEWRVRNIRASQSVAPGRWIFRTQVPGFRRSIGMKRQMAHADAETTHFVFSDGLAAISVFIEPLAEGQARPEAMAHSAGAINVYKRVAGDHLLTVLGEVPAATLKHLGDGIEPKRK